MNLNSVVNICIDWEFLEGDAKKDDADDDDDDDDDDVDLFGSDVGFLFPCGVEDDVWCSFRTRRTRRRPRPEGLSARKPIRKRRAKASRCIDSV